MVNLIWTLTLFHSIMQWGWLSFHCISDQLDVCILCIDLHFLLFAGEQGWLEVVRLQVSHLCDPGSNPGVDAVRGLSLLLVLFFDPGGFSLGTPVFPCPRKKFQFDLGRFVHG